ncbi:malonyl-CoA decarboxylase [soil metagenome]
MSKTASLSTLLASFSRQGKALLRKYGLVGGLADGRDKSRTATMDELANTLMSVRGEASGVAIASDLLSAYADSTPDERTHFLTLLATRFGPDPATVDLAIARYREEGEAALLSLARAVEPPRQELLRRLNLAPGATAMLVQMRADLLARMKGDAGPFAALDADFAHLFTSWFNRGFLTMQAISWDSPASLLERVIRYEAVHDVEDWEDLRNRLGPEDRRCFAFFHPALPGEPLIFVEVALTATMADNVQEILRVDRPVLKATEATTAIFYSLSNCQPGLKGIGFGHFLSKQVATDLQRSLPGLIQFATLSPAPGFCGWLRQADPRLAERLGEERWWAIDDASLRDRLLARAVDYFREARTPSGRPVDSVARFHLGNGAVLERINWMGDTSPRGLKQSAGLMVNYLYDLASIEENHEAFAHRGEVATGAPFNELAQTLAQADTPQGKKPKKKTGAL